MKCVDSVGYSDMMTVQHSEVELVDIDTAESRSWFAISSDGSSEARRNWCERWMKWICPER
jgi:hypothetical protein